MAHICIYPLNLLLKTRFSGTLTAEVSKVNDIFQQEPLNNFEKEMRFTTQGRIVDERLRKVKV